MARPKKDYQILNVKLESNIANSLEHYVEKTGLTKTAAVERILNSYLEKWNVDNSKDSENMRLHQEVWAGMSL